jgi:hypothetical protein
MQNRGNNRGKDKEKYKNKDNGADQVKGQNILHINISNNQARHSLLSSMKHQRKTKINWALLKMNGNKIIRIKQVQFKKETFRKSKSQNPKNSNPVLNHQASC